MTTEAKMRQGTAAWFEVLARLMSEAASWPGLRPDAILSLLERYIDGAELTEDPIQGIRFYTRWQVFLPSRGAPGRAGRHGM